MHFSEFDEDESKDNSRNYSNGKNMRVESEVTEEVHFGSGPQRGIKMKMQEAETKESLKKTFTPGHAAKYDILKQQRT